MSHRKRGMIFGFIMSYLMMAGGGFSALSPFLPIVQEVSPKERFIYCVLGFWCFYLGWFFLRKVREIRNDPRRNGWEVYCFFFVFASLIYLPDSCYLYFFTKPVPGVEYLPGIIFLGCILFIASMPLLIAHNRRAKTPLPEISNDTPPLTKEHPNPMDYGRPYD